MTGNEPWLSATTKIDLIIFKENAVCVYSTAMSILCVASTQGHDMESNTSKQKTGSGRAVTDSGCEFN